MMQIFVAWWSDLEYGVEPFITRSDAQSWMCRKKNETPSTQFRVFVGRELKLEQSLADPNYYIIVT